MEAQRQNLSFSTPSAKKAQFGQYLTPHSIASFMAGLFSTAPSLHCRLLDPGAGIGSLTGAFLEKCLQGHLKFSRIDVDAFEIDPDLSSILDHFLSEYSKQLPMTYAMISNNFIVAAAKQIFSNKAVYTHAIINPPYKKIHSGSATRLILKKFGVDTVNMYSAFVALSLELLQPGGQLVAIIPRSFCNGTYFRNFRRYILKNTAIKHIHSFDARDKAFKDDGVLQENVIISLVKNVPQETVIISNSSDHVFSDLKTRAVDFEQIVWPNDSEQFIRIPTDSSAFNDAIFCKTTSTLADLSLCVSTGPVVDFRLRPYLRKFDENNTIPLLYSHHFKNNSIMWPDPSSKKPNYIVNDQQTLRFLYPNGYYCVVRRFSSKEEKKRVVAAVADPTRFKSTSMLAFENHLNVFHDNKKPLSRDLAYGLAAYLNSMAVDKLFRSFSGHTQINATDLRQINYPSLKHIMDIGSWAATLGGFPQTEIDGKIASILQ